MADAINLFDARRSKWVTPDGSLTREAQIFIRDLWLRTGGAVAPGNNDLAAEQFDDAGIEETKALIYAFNDASQLAPPQLDVVSLFAQPSQDTGPIAQLDQRIEALETINSELKALVQQLFEEIKALQEIPA